MKSVLSEELRWRTREWSDGPVCPEGEFVLYWMRTAQRGHENPALDVAVEVGNHLGRPVVVALELGPLGSGPYRTARHLAFQWEGARDMREELEARGIACALWWRGGGAEESLMPEVGRRAAVIITEDLPTYWFREQTEDVLRRVRGRGEVCALAVDTACVVPMSLVEGRLDRAYKFRKVHSKLLEEHLGKPWLSPEPEVGRFAVDDLDAGGGSLGELLLEVEVDHGVGVVADTPGGAKAGYRRWEAFRDQHLAGYHRERNDAAQPEAVSRMSAYLHFGQVSPFRIAAEARAHGGDGARKYLDEMVTWREFAHHVGTWQTEAPGVKWLPEWARQTLAEGEEDPREVIYDRETLSLGRTDDELWNLCQRSLRAHGELHNNLRMTWGKKLLEWTSTVEEAIEVAVELNDRFALDGGDPNSYLGLLWCFGAFDRPFPPAREIVGTVRGRSTERHRERLDMEAYRGWVERSSQKGSRVAIVGSGVSAAAAARVLRAHHVEVQVYEKARGPGGRTSTRRQGELRFDHGAQYFTARSESLRRNLSAWVEQGVVAPYTPRMGVFDDDGWRVKGEEGPVERYVGVGGMNGLPRHLLGDTPVGYGTRLVRIDAAGGGSDRLTLIFDVEGEANQIMVDELILTAPAPQAADLLERLDPELASRARAVRFRPTWAVMATIADVELPVDAGFVNRGPLSWVAENRCRPGGTGELQHWVLHGSPEWSEEHLEDDPEEVAEQLWEAFCDLWGDWRGSEDRLVPESLTAHRWRYARAEPALETGVLRSRRWPITLAGDWLRGSRVEGAFLSGQAAASEILWRLANAHRCSGS